MMANRETETSFSSRQRERERLEILDDTFREVFHDAVVVLSKNNTRICAAKLHSPDRYRGQHTHLRTIFDVVAFLEAQVTEVTRRRPLSWFSVQQSQFSETIRKLADIIRKVAAPDRGTGIQRRAALRRPR